MRVYVLACLLLAGIVACEEVVSYRGCHVYSVKPGNEEQAEFVQALVKKHNLTDMDEIGSWDFVVPAEKRQVVEKALNKAGLTFTVSTTDLQDQIDAERMANMASHSRSSSSSFPDHQSYYSSNEINDFLHSFASRYPKLVAVKRMNLQTHRHQTIYYLQMGANVGDRNRPVIFMESLTHAREWVSGAAVLYTIDKMLKGYVGGNETIREAMDRYTWVIVPIVNPDGYEHSRTINRLWRKNLRDNGNCAGVDLNRNYAANWGTIGVNMNCDSDIYPGEYAFSEPETQNIRNLFMSLKNRIVAYIAVHSYSQILLHPWNYVRSENNRPAPSNLPELLRVGELMLNHLHNYRIGTAFQTINYAAAGGSSDWALQEKPNIYSYTYELRPSSWEDGGFILDPKYIIPTGDEVLQSLIAMSQHMNI